MHIGSRRNIIHVEQRTSAGPTTSGSSETWSLFCGGLYAAIWPLKGDEAVIGLQTQGEITHRIRCRYRAGVLPGMRVRFGARLFSIAAPAINLDERGEEMELICSEVVRG